jgi:hypothetical protein
MDVITAADVGIVDKNLGQRATTISPIGHFVAGGIIAIDRVFGIFYALVIEQSFGSNAKGAGSPGINFDIGHDTDSKIYAINSDSILRLFIIAKQYLPEVGQTKDVIP